MQYPTCVKIQHVQLHSCLLQLVKSSIVHITQKVEVREKSILHAVDDLLYYAVKNFLRCARSVTANMKTFTIVVHPTNIASKDVSGDFCGNDKRMPWWLRSHKGNNK